MKIGVDISCFKRTGGGVVKAIQQLINESKKLYPEIEIVAFSSRIDLRNNFNFRCKKFFYMPLPFNLHIKYLENCLKDCDFLLFGNNGEHAPLFKNHKNISIIHDVLPLELSNYFKNEQDKETYIKNTQEVIDNSSLIFTDSEYSKQQILNNFKCHQQVIVMYLGVTVKDVDESEIDRKLYPESYFIFNGGYDKRKGIIQLLKALIEVSEENQNFHSKLVLTGRPKYFSEDFKKLMIEAKNKDLIIQTGFINNEELTKLIKCSKAIFYPSRYEGFGLPIVEGMALGCPVVVSKGTCIEEIAQDAAIYIDIDNSNSVKNILNKLDAHNRDAYKEYIKKGKELAKKYTWNNTINIFFDGISAI